MVFLPVLSDGISIVVYDWKHASWEGLINWSNSENRNHAGNILWSYGISGMVDRINKQYIKERSLSNSAKCPQIPKHLSCKREWWLTYPINL